MARYEDPDHAYRRHQAQADEDLSRERRADRLAAHTPAIGYGSGDCGGSHVTSAMTTLAWTVLNGSDYDRRDACRVLAELVLEAG